MAKISLPDGCKGLDFPDGSKVSGKGGGSVEVSEAQARQIDNSWYGRSNVMGGQKLQFGTRKGMRCRPCKRLWNAWNDVCPRCGEQTVED